VQMSTVMRDKAVVALMRARTVTEVAEELGIAPGTLRNWMKTNDKFRAAYDDARKQLLNRAVDELLQGGGEAAATLRKVINGPEGFYPPGPQVAAARSLLDVLLKGCGGA
jgi:predicted transcriptional regulator